MYLSFSILHILGSRATVHAWITEVGNRNTCIYMRRMANLLLCIMYIMYVCLDVVKRKRINGSWAAWAFSCKCCVAGIYHRLLMKLVLMALRQITCCIMGIEQRCMWSYILPTMSHRTSMYHHCTLSDFC